MSLKTTIHREAGIFQELEPEWNALLHRAITDTIFLTIEWQSTWWQHYQAGELLIITCRDENNHLIGIAPWFIQHSEAERVVRTVGCVDVTDYVDVIVHPDYLQPVMANFASVLAEQRSRYDRINLCNIPEVSPTLEKLPEALNACGFTVELVIQEVCPVIHLPDTWEGYLEALDKKQRHEIRRKIRRAEGEAELNVITVTDQAGLNAHLETFITLMAASQPSKAEFLRNSANASFFRAVLPTIAARGWLRMTLLQVNQEAVAAYCDFDYQGKTLVYNSGLLPDRYSHLSTGIVLLAYNIQHAIEKGNHLFDFLRGNETYKYRMGGQDTKVFKLMARSAA